MLFNLSVLLSALSAVTYATPTCLTSAIRDSYPTSIGNPTLPRKSRNPQHHQTPQRPNPICNVAWSEYQNDNSFPSCSSALNLCEPVGGRPLSDKDCAKILTGYEGKACMECTSGINGWCHINPEAYKQFSEEDACKKSTEQCVNEDDCINALFDCENAGGPEISEDQGKYVIIGSNNEARVPMEVACQECTSYQNGVCLLNEMNLEAFEKDDDLV